MLLYDGANDIATIFYCAAAVFTTSNTLVQRIFFSFFLFFVHLGIIASHI
jgi:hypothetical protein